MFTQNYTWDQFANDMYKNIESEKISDTLMYIKTIQRYLGWTNINVEWMKCIMKINIEWMEDAKWIE